MIRVYQNDPSNPYSISSNRVFSIYEDDNGIFWIGTMGEGLNRFDPVNEQFKVYTERNGLPNNVVYVTLEDREGNLWLSTNWGLSKFNKQNEIFVNYDTKDGVQGNEFNAGAYFQNRNGEMYFGGMNGFNVFYPAEITLNRIPPRMVFTGLRILNDLVDTDIENGEIIRLSYTENFFSIEFSGLDYTNPSKNLYRYKLDNYDEGWVFANAGQRSGRIPEGRSRHLPFPGNRFQQRRYLEPGWYQSYNYYQPSLVEDLDVPVVFNPDPGRTFMEHHHSENKKHKKKT